MLNYIKPLFSNILTPDWTVSKNVAYGPLPEQDMDLYLLNAQGNPRNIVVMIHGGGWSAGDKSVYEGRARRFALAGFSVASINYTLAKDGNTDTEWPRQLWDVVSAISYLERHYPGSNIFVMGDSAGGHLALFAAIRNKRIKGCANFFGPCDLTQPNVRNILLTVPVIGKRAYNGFPNLYRQFSPIEYIIEPMCPVFIVHGKNDTLIPYEQALRLSGKLKALGSKYQLVTHDGGHDLSTVSSFVNMIIEMKSIWFFLNLVK
jgi:acetyl esterase/lipase